ncbi:MAG: NAD(P)H-hydrate dehydratase [Chitinophagaceae bacterium]
MKLFSAEEIRLWDQYTIQHEPISSINLMERAAAQCADWLKHNNYTNKSFHIFCGKGNNGGDGLAIARMLSERKMTVTVHILEFGHKGTDDFQINLARLHQYPGILIRFIQTEENFHGLSKDDVVIDALFGSGLNRGLDGVTAKLVKHINDSCCTIISIDVPSGLFTDKSSKGEVVIKADHTLSFQCYKLAFLAAENSVFVGEIHILDIGLHPDFYPSVFTKYELTDDTLIHSIYKPRNNFGHKGNFGHALIVAGSYGKIGAAVLSAKACLRSGAGLLSCHIPKCGYDIMQTALPEAMVMTDFNSSFITKIDDDLAKYEAIGAGPGIGVASETKMMLKEILAGAGKPLVLDADALNIIASQKDLLKLIPAGSILTPHLKEFERLFGESENEFERIERALKKALELNLIIVVKGHHTLIASPDGKAFFNSTGNAGMATAGSGDTLTGILTGLLAQRYSSVDTAILGVYIHGMAGDLAVKKLSKEAMIAGDIIDHLPEAFISLSTL